MKKLFSSIISKYGNIITFISMTIAISVLLSSIISAILSKKFGVNIIIHIIILIIDILLSLHYINGIKKIRKNNLKIHNQMICLEIIHFKIDYINSYNIKVVYKFFSPLQKKIIINFNVDKYKLIMSNLVNYNTDEFKKSIHRLYANNYIGTCEINFKEE